MNLKRLLLFLAIAFTIPTLLAQKKVEIKKELMELSPSESLAKELGNIIAQEEKCSHFNDELIWSIGINEYEGGCLLNITMQSEISTEYEYSGYFYINDYLFVISGLVDNNLFSKKERKTVLIPSYQYGEEEVFTTDIEDFSTWIYFFRNNQLSLQKEYILPCD